MELKLKPNPQSRLELRDGVLCVVVKTPTEDSQPSNASSDMQQWFRVEEPDASAATVTGRPVRNIDPQDGLFVDEEGNSYRLAGGGQAKPDYAEVIPGRIAGNRPATPQGTREARRHSRRAIFR